MTWFIKLNNRQKPKRKLHFNAKTQRLFVNLINEGRFSISKSGLVTNNRTSKLYDRIGNHGYVEVAVRVKSKKYSILAHRLVWLYFKGWIEEDMVINHKNGIKHINAIDNLEKITVSKNNEHAWKTGLFKYTKTMKFTKKVGQRGERSSSAKLSNKDAQHIRMLYKQGGLTHRSLAKMYNVNHTTIGAILNNRSFKKGFFLKLNRKKRVLNNTLKN